ncbi:phosphorylase family protein [Deefgea salmonis]|uniref:Response regulator n=1 Tax=Deefgea salmonis TaxID=2875502 RepID=A0ABS8BKY7_9NEIS|nr:response regulator [Deefgea salmonis]MCB5196384.1 response regulator [Deefgea salmonis]
MKVLIVDDQYNDTTKLISSTLIKLGVSEPMVVQNSNAALRAMEKNQFDLLVLDLQIPDILGGDINTNGGVELINSICIRANVLRPRNIVAVTSHNDSYEENVDFFRSRGWVLINANNDTHSVSQIIHNKFNYLYDKHAHFDVVFITALEHTELEELLKFDLKWDNFSLRDNPSNFYSGEITTTDGKIKKILAVSLPRMGMSSAAALTATICEKFTPKLVIMTGIAAGIKGKVELGDILVAESTWDWGSGKLTIRDNKVIFLSAPHQLPLDAAIYSKFKTLAVSRKYLDEIYSNWKGGKRPPHSLSMHVGPIATGAVVLEDPNTTALIQEHNKNTIGIEMEAYGVMSAVHQYSIIGTKAIIIKSVCDFADPHKNDDWQKYAAYTSASMALKFLEHEYTY